MKIKAVSVTEPDRVHVPDAVKGQESKYKSLEEVIDQEGAT